MLKTSALAWGFKLVSNMCGFAKIKQQGCRYYEYIILD